MTAVPIWFSTSLPFSTVKDHVFFTQAYLAVASADHLILVQAISKARQVY